VRLGVDADAAELVRSRHDCGAVPGAVGHAANHPGRPPRSSVGVGQDRDGGHPDPAQSLAGAMAHGGELEATLGDRFANGGGLDREHRRLRDVGEHLGARRSWHQCLDHRRGPRATSEWPRIEVGDSHAPIIEVAGETCLSGA
jgi:hypothetical protein